MLNAFYNVNQNPSGSGIRCSLHNYVLLNKTDLPILWVVFNSIHEVNEEKHDM